VYHAVEDNSLQCCVLWLCIATNFGCWIESRGQSDDWVPESKRSGTWSGCPPLWLQYCTHTSSATVSTRPHHSHSAAPPHQGRVSICSYCKQQIEISNYINFHSPKGSEKKCMLKYAVPRTLMTVYVSCLKMLKERWTSFLIHCITKLHSLCLSSEGSSSKTNKYNNAL